MCRLWGGNLGRDVVGQSLDPLFDADGETVNLSSDEVEPVLLILTLLQAADPVRGEMTRNVFLSTVCSCC